MSLSAVRLVWSNSSEQSASRTRLEPSAANAQHRFVLGDNLDALGHVLPELEGQVTLAYLDPPFFTGRAHQQVTRRVTPAGISRDTSFAFDDRWDDLAAYLSALKARLALIHRALSPRGSVVIHVDPKTSHYVKVLCDELFGADAFASEIIWRYRRWPAKTNNFQRVHDVLLRYVREPDGKPCFNQLYEPLAASTQQTWGANKQRAVVGSQGRRVRSSTLTEASPGAPLGDVWEIGILAPVARERTGYPTQKPEALLDRLVRSLSDPGDLVLDAYAGSGTTLAVAAKLGRRSFGIDAGEGALQITTKRLLALGADVAVQRVVSAGEPLTEARDAASPTPPQRPRRISRPVPGTAAAGT